MFNKYFVALLSFLTLSTPVFAQVGTPTYASSFTLGSTSIPLGSTTATVAGLTLSGATFSTAGSVFAIAAILNNGIPISGRDTGGTVHSLLQYFSDNKVYLDGGSAGFIWRTNNGGTQFATVDASTTKPLVTWGNSAGVPTHIGSAQTTAPALTSCGTGSPAISGTDTAGTVTMGTSATGCVITFNVTYVAAPYCNVTWRATPLASQSYTVSATAITLTQTSTSSNLIDYNCLARSGG